MAKKIKNLIAYILDIENKDRDTAETLLNILYLADWKSAIERHGKTISNLDYTIKNDKISSLAYTEAINHIFSIYKKSYDNIQDIQNVIIERPNLSEKDYLSENEKKYIDFVCSFLKEKKLNSDIAIHTTYPLFSFSDKEEMDLNLSSLAKDYIQNVRPRLKENA